MVDHAAKIIHDQIFSDGANPYRTLNSASQMRERYMTEIQGWIAIVLLLLILVQLVKLYIEDRRAVPKILWNRLTRRRTQSLRG
jgi:hypothetical protein